MKQSLKSVVGYVRISSDSQKGNTLQLQNRRT